MNESKLKLYSAILTEVFSGKERRVSVWAENKKSAQAKIHQQASTWEFITLLEVMKHWTT